MSKYVGEAVKTFGGHNLRKRNTVGITPWGVIHNNSDLLGRDVRTKYVHHFINNMCQYIPVLCVTLIDSWWALDVTFSRHGLGIQALPAPGKPVEQESLS